MRPWPHSDQTDAPPWSDWHALLRARLPIDWSPLLDALTQPVAVLAGIRDVFAHNRRPPPALEPHFTEQHWLHRAGDHRSPVRRDALRAALCDLRWPLDVSAARQLLTDETRPVAGPLLDSLQQHAAFYRQLQRTRLALAGLPPPPDIRAEAQDDLRCGLRWLQARAPWPDSWEVQARGLYGSPPLTGSWFVRGLIRLALHTSGLDQGDAIRSLLSEPPPGDLRYYAPCPPDADSLGLALQLAAVIPDPPRARIGSWLAVMHRYTGADGLVPTWLGEGRVRWSGGDCPSVRLSLVSGLLAWDPDGLGGLARANLRHALATLDRRYHYVPAYSDLLLYRALSQVADPAMRDEQRALVERVQQTQQADGGWGGPLETACCLQILAAAGAPALTLLRAMRYAGDAQRSDGSWPEAPLYVIPLPRDRIGWHSGRALSCALHTTALSAALRATAPHARDD